MVRKGLGGDGYSGSRAEASPGPLPALCVVSLWDAQSVMEEVPGGPGTQLASSVMNFTLR